MEEQDNRVEMSIEQIYFDEISQYPLLTAAEELVYTGTSKPAKFTINKI